MRPLVLFIIIAAVSAFTAFGVRWWLDTTNEFAVLVGYAHAVVLALCCIAGRKDTHP